MRCDVLDACIKFAQGLDNHHNYVIAVEEVKKYLESGDQGKYFIIDIRSQEAYIKGHLPGSYNFPLETLPEMIDEIPRKKTVLIVSKGDYHCAYATAILRILGFDAVIMKGGFKAWIDSGGNLVASN